MFDRSNLILEPLSGRTHDLGLDTQLPLKPSVFRHPALDQVAERIVAARQRSAAVILMMGGHVIRSGIQRFLIDLIEKRNITCLAMNGAGAIHDYELALAGGTTESVTRYIKTGQFGLWRETGGINDIIRQAHDNDPRCGYGLALGRAIHETGLTHGVTSLLACCYRTATPATVHVSIGQDIIHQHPNFNPAATGTLSYNDFLSFTDQVTQLQHGVVMNFGSAVMGPEIFLKALAMARNVVHQKGREIRRFTSLVTDLHRLPEDIRQEPAKTEPTYYFRPLKTLLVRTVADGGKAHYVRGRHRDTVPGLWTAIQRVCGSQNDT